MIAVLLCSLKALNAVESGCDEMLNSASCALALVAPQRMTVEATPQSSVARSFFPLDTFRSPLFLIGSVSPLLG
ncbi:hypothetical protein D3C83_88360 [compost metagenome]